MSLIITPKTGLLFMKVGLHAGESFHQILERKRAEYRRTGVIFWGYGGGTCHPHHVQPFARLRVEAGEQVYLIMEEIDSRHPPTSLVASQYSEDGIDWKPIPDGIQVRGSRYALVLGEIKEGDLDITFSEYEVAAGPSTGKSANGYIGGRVDKACLVRAAQPSVVTGKTAKISHFAQLQPPYAVFTK
jgi:hypothetical protein